MTVVMEVFSGPLCGPISPSIKSVIAMALFQRQKQSLEIGAKTRQQNDNKLTTTGTKNFLTRCL